MLRYFGLFFLLYVVAEMALLITLGRKLGVLPTIFLVLGAGAVGVWIAKWQGFRTALKAREEMMRGVAPTSQMIDGVLIAVAAVLLFIPGVIGDVLGLMLLLPPVRAVVRKAIFGKAAMVIRRGDGEGVQSRSTGGDRIIEARVIETRVVDE